MLKSKQNINYRKRPRRPSAAARKLQETASRTLRIFDSSEKKDHRALLKHPEPGLFRGVPDDVYRQIDAINQSRLQKLRISPFHFRYATAVADTQSTRVGTLLHVSILEPHELERRYIAEPDFERTPTLITRADGSRYDNVKATKVYKERREAFRKANPGKVSISIEQYNTLARIVKSLGKHVRPFLAGSDRELTVIWKDKPTGILCKARLDIVNWEQNLLGDLKTTESLLHFPHHMAKYGYHIQQAFYQMGVRALTGKSLTPHLLIVENQDPHDSDAAKIHPADLRTGRREARELLNLLADCRSNRRWPGINRPVLRLPRHYRPFTAGDLNDQNSS